MTPLVSLDSSQVTEERTLSTSPNETDKGSPSQQAPSTASNNPTLYTTAGSNITGDTPLRYDSNITPNCATFSTSGVSATDSLYLTARTNVSEFNGQSSHNPTDNVSNIAPISHTLDKYEHEKGDDLLHDLPESLHLEQLLHKPPYISHTHLGRSSLRQTIISRQSTRLIPANDRLVDYMEEQLVRWRVPGSSFRADDILDGKHPYQQNNISNHEVLGSGNNSTDSMVNSIARSPFVSVEQGTLKRGERTKSTFKEHNGSASVNGSDKEKQVEESTEDDFDDRVSIQESLNFQYNMHPHSVSVSSSIMHQIEETTNDQLKKNTINVQSAINIEETVYSAKTIDAQQIERSDIEKLVKDHPESTTDIIFNQQENHNIDRIDYLGENAETGCWDATVEAWCEIWLECAACLTCNFDTDDTYYLYDNTRF